MNEKDLSKLKRVELLEILLLQSKEIERLEEELSIANQQLEDKTILISKAGSIAEASLKLTNVFAEAQNAANLYLHNVKNLSKEYEKQVMEKEKEMKHFLDSVKEKAEKDDANKEVRMKKEIVEIVLNEVKDYLQQRDIDFDIDDFLGKD